MNPLPRLNRCPSLAVALALSCVPLLTPHVSHAQIPGAHPAPGQKTLLLVTTTLGFHHAAIPLQEKLIRDYAAAHPEIRIISTSDSPDYPTAEYKADVDRRNARISADQAQDNDRPWFLGVYDGLPGSTPEQRRAVTDALATYAASNKKEADARAALSAAIVSGAASESDLKSRVDSLTTAERELAYARLDAMQKVQSGPHKLTPRQLKIVQSATTGNGGFGGGAPAAMDDARQAQIAQVNRALAPLAEKDGEAHAALTTASFSGTRSEIDADISAAATADQAYATAAAREFASLATPLSPAEQAQFARNMGIRMSPPVARRAPGPDPIADKVAKVLQQYLNSEALKRYDAVAFLSTTGDLPIPDKEAFYRWIADGHGFIGLHSATDTLHHDPRYIEMIGGEFQTHGMIQPKVPVINVDPSSPINAGWGRSIALNEEFYIIKSFDPRKVHLLLELQKQPYTGEATVVPISWIRSYGKGRVFYTSLGHRDDVLLDAPIGDQEFKRRYNDASVSKAVDQHILNGIRFALGLLPSDTTPQAH